MSGLAGVLQFRGDPPSDRDAVALLEGISHRGPHGHGEFADGPARLIHSRLAIRPVPNPQPVISPDLVMLLDGWIYDVPGLARRAGHEGADLPGVQALMLAWRRFGIDVLEHVEGDFALAVWERGPRRLTLVRDRLGVRPLFWTREGDRFAFASEIPALLRLPWVSGRLNRDAVAEYLSFRVVHAPRTLLEDIHPVAPGHWLQVDAHALRTRKWWQLRYAPPWTAKPAEGEVIEALQEAVGRAVARRMPPESNIPVGIYLSGGLGSTAIAAAARDLGRTLPSFTLGFADDPNPESPFAGRVARLLGTEHHEVLVGTAELAGSFDEAVSALGQPIGNPAVVLQLALAKAAGEHVRVVFSGDGGEELFGGRMLDDLPRLLRQAQQWRRIPTAFRRALAPLIERSAKGRAITASPERFGWVAGLGGSDQFDYAARKALLRDPDLARPELRQAVLRPFYEDLDTDPVNAVLHAYLCSWLAEGSLNRSDRTAARAGLDVRFPLLDTEVLRRAASLPGSFKLRRTGGSVHARWPLRAMLSGVLPPPLVNRPKRGMPTPLDGWFQGQGRLFMEERMSRLQQDPHRLFRPEALAELRRRVVAGQRGAGIQLWVLFIFDAWLASLR